MYKFKNYNEFKTSCYKKVLEFAEEYLYNYDNFPQINIEDNSVNKDYYIIVKIIGYYNGEDQVCIDEVKCDGKQFLIDGCSIEFCIGQGLDFIIHIKNNKYDT